VAKIKMTDDTTKRKLTASEISSIENAVRKAATDHLNAPDADTALSHYKPDATIISNGMLYETFQLFEKDTRKFYNSLKEVKLAIWDNIRVRVINSELALFTASVRWSSVDKLGSVFELKGVWSAVYCMEEGNWKILLRHESFEPNKLIE
jgi:ketosteroid isomerase-like protein